MFIVCSSCQSKNRVPDDLAGKQGKCPRCGAVLNIPAAGEAIAAPTAPSDQLPESGDAQSPSATAPAPIEQDSPSQGITVAGAPAESPSAETHAAEGTGPPAVAASYTFLGPPQGPDELGRLGPYRVLQVLGQGGMGIVFVAEDTRLGRQVALKAMLPEMATKPAARERFLREARTAAAIEHDHIVAIYQVDEDRGVPYIAMPLLKGCSLEDWLRRQGQQPLPVSLILKLGKEIAAGLAAAHAHGLIHRDIKPANIFLQGRGSSATGKDSTPSAFLSLTPADGLRAADCRVKILDFGLARLTAGEQHLTLSGVIMGTPAYMAPEQARTGSQVDARADLFSLGVVLYRLCTGILPFQGDDMMSVLMSLAMDQPASPRLVNPALPQALSDLVMRLLAKDPSERIQSAEDVVQALATMETPPVAAVATPPKLTGAVLLETEDAIAPAGLPGLPPLPHEEPVRREEEIEVERAPGRRRRSGRYDEDDEWDPADIAKKETSGMSQAAMITGIVAASVSVLSMCCCNMLMPLAAAGGLAAIGLGIVGMKQGGRSQAQTGIALGAAALLLALMSLALLLLGVGINLANMKGRF